MRDLIKTVCVAVIILLIIMTGCVSDSSEEDMTSELSHFSGIIVDISNDNSVLIYSENIITSSNIISVTIDDDTVNDIERFEQYQSVEIAYIEPVMETYPPIVRANRIESGNPSSELDIEKAVTFYEEFLRKQESEISVIMNPK